MRRRLLLTAACLLVASLMTPAATAQSSRCGTQHVDTLEELLECVSVEGTFQHLEALQAIADANGGTRVSGSEGYDESVDYVVRRMVRAGYDVHVQPFQFNAFIQEGPSELTQNEPDQVTYVEGVDYQVMSQSEPGDVTADVTAVDLMLGLDNTSTSGCEPEDFEGFPAGNIALIQRGSCTFQVKAENAADAGAVGVLIFNQGNTEDRMGLIGGTLGAEYDGGIPVMDLTYALGVELAETEGLNMTMVVDVFRGLAITYNVFAESTTGDRTNVVMAGAHLDSVD
ncbi:MAG: aminopeptidase, partial [Actinomycetota bacterium]|nr:aminopeptidase [Actinomycetota bacterium]